MVERASAAFEKLTPREREILRLIAAHFQSKEIARALGLSPKTVEMHVLSARRRLSGMSRRDAALAFVAWEGGDPGNDYRKRPDALAELPNPPLSDREIGNDHDRAPSADRYRPFDDHSTIRRDWRHELSNLQWLGLVLGITAAIAASMAVVAVGVHQLLLTIQRIAAG